MRLRTLCLDCMRTSHPDTVLPGSDLAEIVGWLCLLAPGWLYCAWRHLTRTKICAFCGGGALMRESRSSTAKRPGQDPASATLIHTRRGSARWPRALAEPRTRLRRGAWGAGLGTVALAGWAWAIVAATPGALHWAQVASAVAIAWLLAAAAGVLERRLATSSCRAWRPDGRPLRIELL